MRAVLRNPRLLLVLGTAACFSGTQIAITSFLPIYAREDLGLSATATGAMLSFLQIAGIGSQPVLGYLSDRVGRRLVLALGLLGLTMGSLALYVSGEGLAFYLAVGLTGLFLFPMMAIILALGMDIVGSAVQGATASIIFGVGIVLPPFPRGLPAASPTPTAWTPSSSTRPPPRASPSSSPCSADGCARPPRVARQRRRLPRAPPPASIDAHPRIQVYLQVRREALPTVPRWRRPAASPGSKLDSR